VSFWAALPGILSAGSSLLGGLFGNKGLSPRKQIHLQKNFMEWQWDNQHRQLRGLRTAAEKNGFNPLTVLGSGAGAQMQQTHMPVLADFGGISAGEAISNAVNNGLSAYQAFKSPVEADQAEKTDKKISEAASHVGAGAAGTGPSVGTVINAAPALKERQNLYTPNPHPPTVPQDEPVEAGKRTITNPWPPHWGWEASPYRLDAEMFETAHGEGPGSWWISPYNQWQDVKHNIGRQLNSKKGWKPFGNKWMPTLKYNPFDSNGYRTGAQF